MSTKTRLWVVGAAVVCGALLLYGLFAGLLPQLTSAATTRSLAADAAVQNDIYRAQLAALEAEAERIPELTAGLDELRNALPETTESSALLSSFAALESSSGAQITRYQVLTPIGDGEEAPPAAPTAEDAATESEDDAAGDGSDAAAEASEAPAEAPAAVTPAGIQRIDITIDLAGDAETQLLDFIRGLQTGARLITVDVVSLDFEEGTEEDPWKGAITAALYVQQSE